MPEETAVMESPETTIVPDVEPSTDVQPEPDTTDTPIAEPDKGESDKPVDDGRKIPPALREAFKADPRARDRWFKGGALLERFPEGPKQAEALISTVENLTQQFGVESLDDILPAVEQERSEWNALDEQFSTGSPEFVKNIAESNPEAFAKIMPAALETLANMDGATYDHLMARVVINTIQGPLARAYEVLAADEKTRPAAEELAKWYKGIETLANKQPEKKIDPERQKFEQEKQQFQEQKAKEFVGRAENSMRDYNSSAVEKILEREFSRSGRNMAAEKKANPEAFSIMVENCFNAMRKKFAGDAKTLEQYKVLLATGDLNRVTGFAKPRIDKAAAAVVPNIFKVFNRNPAPRHPATTASQSSSSSSNGGGGAVPLGRIPKQSEIDWPMMRVKGLDGSSGQVYLKGQKQLYSF